MSSFCAFCHAPALYVCERCNVEVYCSVECQKNAFAQHRFICFNLPALRRFNENDLMTPQTPMKNPQNIANDFENLTIKSSTGSAITVIDRKVEAMTEIVKPDKVDELSEETSSGKLLAALNKPVKEVAKQEIVKEVVKEDKSKEKVIVAPKEVQIKAAATPAFNQGPRSTPPSEMTKKLVTPLPKPAPSVVEDKTAFSANDNVDTTMLRRNHQENSAPRLKLPLQKPKIPKIFYADMKVRELTPGKQKVNVMNLEPTKKIFYVLEAFEGIEEYCSWIESSVSEEVASNKVTGYEPDVEEMVLAKFEGSYYRAITTAKKGDKFVVFFIDYGNTADVAPTDIIPFSAKLQMEIILHEVFIENIQVPFNKKTKEILANPEGFEIQVKEERTEMGSYVADLIGL